MRKGLIRISREKSSKFAVTAPYQVNIYPQNGRISAPHSDINELAEIRVKDLKTKDDILEEVIK